MRSECGRNIWVMGRCSQSGYTVGCLYLGLFGLFWSELMIFTPRVSGVGLEMLGGKGLETRYLLTKTANLPDHRLSWHLIIKSQQHISSSVPYKRDCPCVAVAPHLQLRASRMSRERQSIVVVGELKFSRFTREAHWL